MVKGTYMQLPGFTHITFAALSFGAVSYHYVRNRYEENYHDSHALRIFTMAANLCLVLSGLLMENRLGSNSGFVYRKSLVLCQNCFNNFIHPQCDTEY